MEIKYIENQNKKFTHILKILSNFPLSLKPMDAAYEMVFEHRVVI